MEGSTKRDNRELAAAELFACTLPCFALISTPLPPATFLTETPELFCRRRRHFATLGVHPWPEPTRNPPPPPPPLIPSASPSPSQSDLKSLSLSLSLWGGWVWSLGLSFGNRWWPRHFIPDLNHMWEYSSSAWHDVLGHVHAFGGLMCGGDREEARQRRERRPLPPYPSPPKTDTHGKRPLSPLTLPVLVCMPCGLGRHLCFLKGALHTATTMHTTCCFKSMKRQHVPSGPGNLD